MTKPSSEPTNQQANLLELYAAGVHGLMAAGYVFTLPYHIDKHHKVYIVLHVLLSGYHIHSVYKHLKRKGE